MWYHDKVGAKRCPIVDTWWQTETGCMMITPLPGATPLKPGSATLPFFGVDAAVVDDNGKEVGPNVGGKLVIRRPWPSMLRTIYGDAARYRKTYWSEIKGCYFAGDGARRDKDGYFWIVGRIDDVLNVAGHRLGTSPRSKARWSAIPTLPKPQSSAVPMTSRARLCRCLCDAEERRRPWTRLEGSPSRPRRQGNRPHRQAGRYPLR